MSFSSDFNFKNELTMQSATVFQSFNYFFFLVMNKTPKIITAATIKSTIGHGEAVSPLKGDIDSETKTFCIFNTLVFYLFQLKDRPFYIF